MDGWEGKGRRWIVDGWILCCCGVYDVRDTLGVAWSIYIAAFMEGFGCYKRTDGPDRTGHI